MINRDRLAALRKIEDERFLALHPKSGEMFKAGQKNMPEMLKVRALPMSMVIPISIFV